MNKMYSLAYPIRLNCSTKNLKKIVGRASDSFNKFKIDNQKYEEMFSKLSVDLKNLHESFENIFEDLNKSEPVKDKSS